MEDILASSDLKLFNTLSQSCNTVFFYYADVKNDVAHWSESAKEYFGLPSTVLSPSSIWAERIHPNDIDGYNKNFEDMFGGVTPYHNSEYRIKNAEGEYIWVNCRGYMTYDKNGAPEFFAGFVRNMGQITKLDPVTGMWNSYVMRTNLEKLLQDGTEGVAIQLDVRNFKRINAQYGYDFGDSVLYTLGQALLSVCENRATVYRMNGTQFALIVKGKKEDAIKLCKEIDDRIGNISVNGVILRIDTALGATLFPEDGQFFDNINSNLTYALASAKQTNSTDIVFYSNELFEKRNRYIRLNEALQSSIANNFEGFRIAFQPVFDAKTGKLHSAEALLRWSNEDFPNVGPMEFVPILEQTEKIIPVGKWLIDQAFKFVSVWNSANTSNKLKHVNVNFSYIQFSDDTLKDYVTSKLDEYKLPRETLIAELTESCRIVYTSEFANVLQSFREEGVKIALDDFGTGYASLMVLKDTPTDILKLDYTMMRTIQDKPKDRTLVEFIIKYCREIDVDVCAEGVENAGIEKIVTSAGAAFLQGYYYDKPLEADTFFEKYIK
jgi:diguanylate cyclase (GGDEF)-like protein/PAS domain S-box-containing protein